MNESEMSLDDLALFLLVGETGTLTAASDASGTPLPTLSRRMTRLEQQSGRALFLRGKAGYGLTADGRALAARVAGLGAIQRQVLQWRVQDAGPRRVRITAGYWTSQWLVQHMSFPQDGTWVPEFVPSNATLDLARREVDIGVRNHPPDHPWLARQRLRETRFAIYARRDAPEGFLTVPAPGSAPSQRWVHEHHGAQIVTTAQDPRLVLDLARRGAGRVVLPCFIGDAEPDLLRLSEPLEALTHDTWLVSHHEARHDPAIRAALAAVAQCLGPAGRGKAGAG